MRNRELSQRKEPGIIAKVLGRGVSFTVWMITALLISILIEWLGMTLFWPELGAKHAKQMFLTEYEYLNERVRNQISINIYQKNIIEYANHINEWLSQQFTISSNTNVPYHLTEQKRKIAHWFEKISQDYKPYFISAYYIAQLFIVRLTIIILSVFVFVLFGIVGVADGLTERELRRWGGGRESSTMFNLAKNSIYPAFIMACMIYISFPSTIHPSLIMIPFGILFGYSLKMTFEKLKKYF